MTATDALIEAKRRWGREAGILNGSGPGAQCMVGLFEDHYVFTVKGRGSTWEEAFSDADGRAGQSPGNSRR